MKTRGISNLRGHKKGAIKKKGLHPKPLGNESSNSPQRRKKDKDFL
jgi:hypothetical protein